jgi:hypothetical protein
MELERRWPGVAAVVGGAGGASLDEVENETQAIRVALKPSTTEKWAARSCD